MNGKLIKLDWQLPSRKYFANELPADGDWMVPVLVASQAGGNHTFKNEYFLTIKAR